MLLNHFIARCQTLYNLEREVMVDKLIVAYEGKLCSPRQFMRDKPTTYGLKLWCLASPSSHYVYDVSLFEGVEIGKGPHRLGQKVSINFLKPLLNLGHVFVCDSFFSSPLLFYELMVEGTWAWGIVRSDQ